MLQPTEPPSQGFKHTAGGYLDSLVEGAHLHSFTYAFIQGVTDDNEGQWEQETIRQGLPQEVLEEI